MMIFVTTTDALTDEKLYEKAYSLIPEYRKTKADKMKMYENKLQTVTAGLLLNYAVGKWSIKTGERDYKTDENLYEKVDIISVIEANNQYFDYEIAYNSQGKPYFLSNREIFFNISHSSNYVACVIGDRPVGIDIEKARKGRQNLAKRFFDISEAEWIKECDSDQRFFRIWTLKEAYGKAIDESLISGVEELAGKGKYETGNDVRIYISNIKFDATYSYVATSNSHISMIRIYSINAITTQDDGMFRSLKEWVQSLKKFSTQISESGEMQRIRFFNEQREIINTL